MCWLNFSGNLDATHTFPFFAGRQDESHFSEVCSAPGFRPDQLPGCRGLRPGLGSAGPSALSLGTGQWSTGKQGAPHSTRHRQNAHDSGLHDIWGQAQGHRYKWPRAAPAARLLSHLTGCLTPSPEPALQPRAPVHGFNHSVLPSLKRPLTTGPRSRN